MGRLTCDSLWDFTGRLWTPNLQELPGLSGRKLCLFLSVALPLLSGTEPCPACKTKLAHWRGEGVEVPIPQDMVVKGCFLCEVIRVVGQYARGVLSQRECWFRIIDMVDWASQQPRWAARGEQEARAYSDDRAARWAKSLELFHDIVGDPFRNVAIDASLRTPPVVALATSIYEERAWGDMPILADALSEAGCDDTELLGHCRGQGPHCRGCWVVDLLLNKV